MCLLNLAVTAGKQGSHADSHCLSVLCFCNAVDKKNVDNESSSLSVVTIQVNHSPSFSTDTPLDLAVKKKLILETLALVRVDAKQLRRGKAADKQLASERLLRAKGRATADQAPAVSLEEMQSIRSTADCIPADHDTSAI